MSADDSSARASRLALLKRIADALDMPSTALHEPEGAIGDTATLSDDARAMLAAFVKIRDPERRQACLDYVMEIVRDDLGVADAGGPDGGVP